MNPGKIPFCTAVCALSFYVLAPRTHAGEVKAPASESQDAEEVPAPSVRPFIRSATKATAWRVEFVKASGAEKNGGSLRQIGPRVPLQKDQLSRFQEALDDPENIGSSTKFCGFNPIVAVLFEGPGHAVELQFCFLCDDLGVRLDGKDIKVVPIDPGRAHFLKIIKEVFPKDDVIQSLPLENPLHSAAVPGKSKT